jgi:hypothetical protein
MIFHGCKSSNGIAGLAAKLSVEETGSNILLSFSSAIRTVLQKLYFNKYCSGKSSE